MIRAAKVFEVACDACGKFSHQQDGTIAGAREAAQKIGFITRRFTRGDGDRVPIDLCADCSEEPGRTLGDAGTEDEVIG